MGLKIKLSALFLAGSLAATFAYKNHIKSLTYIHKTSEGKMEIDYAKTTNFSFENHDKIEEHEYSKALSSVSPQQLLFAAILGRGQRKVLKQEFMGRWCNTNKCFMVKGRGIELSDKLNPHDDTPSAFFIPESEENGRKWHFYFFLDHAWKNAVAFTFTEEGLPKGYPIKFKKIEENLFYSEVKEDYNKFMPFMVRGDNIHGELPNYIEITPNGDINLNEDFISRYEYDKQQRMKDPVYAKNIKDVDNLFKIRGAINAYGRENGNVRPPRLEDLVPKYIDKIPEGPWDYDPSRSLEIKKD